MQWALPAECYEFSLQVTFSALQSHLFLHKSKILQYVTPNNKGGPNRTFDLWSSVTDDVTSHILIDGATHVAFYKQVLLSMYEEIQSKFFFVINAIRTIP